MATGPRWYAAGVVGVLALGAALLDGWFLAGVLDRPAPVPAAHVLTASGHPDALLAEPFASQRSPMTVVRGGPWRVVGGRLVLTDPATAPGGGVANVAVHPAPVSGPVRIVAALRADSGGVADLALVLGYRGPDDYAYLALSAEGADDPANGLFVVRDGRTTRLAAVPATIAAQRPHAFAVQATGTVLRVWLDGRLVVDARTTAEDVVAGRVGVGTRGAGASVGGLLVTRLGRPWRAQDQAASLPGWSSTTPGDTPTA